MSASHLLRFSVPICCVTPMKTIPQFRHHPAFHLALWIVLHADHWCRSCHRPHWWESSVFLLLSVSYSQSFFTSNLLCITLSLPLFTPVPSFAPSVSSPHFPPLLLPPHHFWLIRPGCQAVFTECPFVDYSPRNHVAQLNYQWLQRLHLLLRHLENALSNQPISAKMSMIPSHKETLLPSLLLLSLKHYCKLWLFVRSWGSYTCIKEFCNELEKYVMTTFIFFMIIYLSFMNPVINLRCVFNRLSPPFFCFLWVFFFVYEGQHWPPFMAEQMLSPKESNIKNLNAPLSIVYITNRWHLHCKSYPLF